VEARSHPLRRASLGFVGRRIRGFIGLDVVVLDDLEPALLLGLLEDANSAGVLARISMSICSPNLRRRRARAPPWQLGGHALDDRRRRAGRGIDAPPRIGRVGLEALLGKRRRVGQAGHALVAGRAERPQLAGAEVRLQRAERRSP
jgi:hypothetical protein